MDAPVLVTAGTVFQFTPPRKGRPCDCIIIQGNTLFQFTPPRKGRPLRMADEDGAMTVSIHAPA